MNLYENKTNKEVKILYKDLNDINCFCFETSLFIVIVINSCINLNLEKVCKFQSYNSDILNIDVVSKRIKMCQ